MPSGVESVQESVGTIDSVFGDQVTSIAESSLATDPVRPASAFLLSDSAAANAPLFAGLSYILTDILQAADTPLSVPAVNQAETVQLSTIAEAYFTSNLSDQVTVSDAAVVALAELLADSVRAADDLLSVYSCIVTDPVNLTVTQLVSYAPELAESVDVLGQFQLALSRVAELTDNVSVVDDFAKNIVLIASIAEAIGASDTLSVIDAFDIVERLLVSGAVTTFTQAAVNLIAAILVADNIVDASALLVTDTLSVGENIPDSSFGLIKKLVLLTEALSIADSFENVLVLAVMDSDKINVADSMQLTKTVFEELLEDVDVYSLVKFPTEIAQGVAMNLEGALPVSEYDNFVYNSLTTFKGKFYGATDEGIYEFSGDTDDGKDITAKITSLMLDFGTSRQKRVRSAYLGYTSSGKLVLRVKSVSQGQLTEDWYEARDITSAPSPRETMMHIGQGLKSRYWQFELTNANGADFEIDVLEMYPIFLGRRV